MIGKFHRNIPNYHFPQMTTTPMFLVSSIYILTTQKLMIHTFRLNTCFANYRSAFNRFIARMFIIGLPDIPLLSLLNALQHPLHLFDINHILFSLVNVPNALPGFCDVSNVLFNQLVIPHILRYLCVVPRVPDGFSGIKTAGCYYSSRCHTLISLKLTQACLVRRCRSTRHYGPRGTDAKLIKSLNVKSHLQNVKSHFQNDHRLSSKYSATASFHSCPSV